MRRTLSIAAGIAVVSIFTAPAVAQDQAATGLVIQAADAGRLRALVPMFDGTDPLILEADSVDVKDAAPGLRITFGGRTLSPAHSGRPAMEFENLQIGLSISPACFVMQFAEWHVDRNGVEQGSGPMRVRYAGKITPSPCAGVALTATRSVAPN